MIHQDPVLSQIKLIAEPIAFTLPGSAADQAWDLELDTTDDQPAARSIRSFSPGESFEIQGCSLALLRQPMAEPGGEAE